MKPKTWYWKKKAIVLISLAGGIGSIIFQIRLFLHQLQGGGIGCLEDTSPFLLIELMIAVMLIVLMIWSIKILLESK